jgi:hypothetical protein
VITDPKPEKSFFVVDSKRPVSASDPDGPEVSDFLET